jgi:hypothetical protein
VVKPWRFAGAQSSSVLGDVGRDRGVRYRWLEATIVAPPAAEDGRGPLPSRRDRPMASLFKRAKDFAQSPKGKQATEEIKEQASKPENRRKLKEFGQRHMKKR